MKTKRNKITAIAIACLLSTSVFTANSQKMENPERRPMGFPFQLRRGMTIDSVAERIDSLFWNKHRREPTSTAYKRFDLSGPKDSIFFDGIGPIASLSYSLFKDTISEVTLEFPRYGRTTIDTARFARSYSYEVSYFLGWVLTLMDSSFAITISPRIDHPSIDFIDREIQEHMRQYQRLLERQLAEDSVVIVVTADSRVSSLPERTIVGQEKWTPLPLLLGERIRFEELKTTIEFKGIGTRKSQRGQELTPENATVFLIVDHSDMKKEIMITTDSNLPRCAGIADDLPHWLVCARSLKRLSDTYQILVNINKWAYR